MTLEQYLKDRGKWQDSTVDHIREKILFKSKNIIKPIHSEKLVAIYGPPQIGKTTLILFLLGIDAEYQKDVYNTLRAGVPRGNSSTSTAIIYQKSENDSYGVKYGADFSEIEYCPEDQLRQRLQDIRRKVESKEASKDILHIYIPSRFFTKDSKHHVGINIVDLPGDGSRNIKEKAHVDALINKYMALATVNIITCKANEINSLSELELPINVDWRNLSHKYIVVITNSFGQGTIKKYFNMKKDDRTCSFLEYVSNVYTDNLKSILKPISEIEVFPIDLGDSLERLSKQSGLSEADSSEVVSAAYSMADRICKSIQERNGNGLKSTIMDLKAYSSEYAEYKSAELSEEIERRKNNIDAFYDDIQKKESIVKTSEEAQVKMKDAHEEYVSLKNTCVLIDGTESLNVILSFIKTQSVIERITDNEHSILSVLQEKLQGFVQSCFEKYGLDNSEKNCQVVYENINSAINLEAEVIEACYPRNIFISSILKKWNTDKMLYSIERLIKLFQSRLEDIIQTEVKKQINDKNSIEKEYQRYSQWIKECSKAIKSLQEKIEIQEKQVALLREERNNILERKEADKKLIEDYLQIAKSEFYKYRSELIEKIDSNQLPAEEKVCVLIYLSLLEKDYQSIIEMG